jgi:hypothetical protein
MSAIFKAARALGWTSLAVGATEIVATRWLEDQMGVDQSTLIRAFGVREIAAGASILSQPGITTTLANSVWARVIGDVLDLGALTLAAGSSRRPSGLTAIGAIVLTITGIDVFVAAKLQTDLHRQKVVSRSAGQRVERHPALPNKPEPVGA